MTNKTLYAEMSTDGLKDLIDNMESNLTDARGVYDEKRYSNLRTLVETQKATSKAIREEMDKLGYKDVMPPLALSMLNNLSRTGFPIKF